MLQSYTYIITQEPGCPDSISVRQLPGGQLPRSQIKCGHLSTDKYLIIFHKALALNLTIAQTLTLTITQNLLIHFIAFIDFFVVGNCPHFF